VLDWSYYIERLGGTIQKIINIPAALQVKFLNLISFNLEFAVNSQLDEYHSNRVFQIQYPEFVILNGFTKESWKRMTS
jgi:hypothetical protein